MWTHIQINGASWEASSQPDQKLLLKKLLLPFLWEMGKTTPKAPHHPYPPRKGIFLAVVWLSLALTHCMSLPTSPPPLREAMFLAMVWLLGATPSEVHNHLEAQPSPTTHTLPTLTYQGRLKFLLWCSWWEPHHLRLTPAWEPNSRPPHDPPIPLSYCATARQADKKLGTL